MNKGETGRQARTVYLDMNAFKWYLKRNNLTMASLSTKMGRSKGYIKNAVAFGYMRTETLRPIADALNTDMSELIFTGDESPEPLTPVTNGPMCNQRGKCFARSENGRCSLLTETYSGKCPFQKERRGA